MEYLIRTRFAEDIVAEVALPLRQSGKVAILANGLPSSPVKRGVLEFLADQGYVAIAPRYRGTWESQGIFLKKSPAQDVRDILDDLAKKGSIRDLFSGEILKVSCKAVHLFGSSFGGPAVLLNSGHRLVKKVIVLSPIIDWSAEGPDEPFDFFVRFTQDGFGDAYRPKDPRDWQRLLSADFYNPLSRKARIDGKKILILHAKDDRMVPCQPLPLFARNTGASYYLKPKGGHLGFSVLLHKFYWKKIAKFLGSGRQV